MELPLLLLAILGFAAVARRFVLAALRIARVGVDAFAARAMAEARAQRGDLTGMAEAKEWAERARRARWKALGELGFWLALLASPPLLFRSPAQIYALYSIFWLWRDGDGRAPSSDGDQS